MIALGDPRNEDEYDTEITKDESNSKEDSLIVLVLYQIFKVISKGIPYRVRGVTK